MRSTSSDVKMTVEMAGSHYYDLLREARNAHLVDLAGGTPAPFRSMIADWLYNLAQGIDNQVHFRNQRATV